MNFIDKFDLIGYELILISCVSIDNRAINKKVLKAYKLPLIWFNRNPGFFNLVMYLYNLVYVTLYLLFIIIKDKIDIIYSNNIKSHIYGSILHLITRRKTVCYIRDNLHYGLITKFLLFNCNKIICVSIHIYQQIPLKSSKKKVIYGGVDIDEWNPYACLNKKLKSQLNIDANSVLIAQIGQITRWKNHIDFIKAAQIIRKRNKNVHFLIVGDDLSGREKKYKSELIDLITELKLDSSFSFLGHREDIKEITNQIDILIHPAINEPFGRVIIESMAMEKPVVSYHCGGIKEIILNEVTGYLVEPYDYLALADRTTILLKDKDLRLQFGKAGRKRVLEKFNMQTYIREMEELLVNL